MKINEAREQSMLNSFMEQHYPEKVIEIKSPKQQQRKRYKKVVQDKQLIDF